MESRWKGGWRGIDQRNVAIGEGVLVLDPRFEDSHVKNFIFVKFMEILFS